MSDDPELQAAEKTLQLFDKSLDYSFDTARHLATLDSGLLTIIAAASLTFFEKATSSTAAKAALCSLLASLFFCIASMLATSVIHVYLVSRVGKELPKTWCNPFRLSPLFLILAGICFFSGVLCIVVFAFANL